MHCGGPSKAPKYTEIFGNIVWHMQSNATEPKKKCKKLRAFSRIDGEASWYFVHVSIGNAMNAFWCLQRIRRRRTHTNSHRMHALCFVSLPWKLMPLNEFRELLAIVHVWRVRRRIYEITENFNIKFHKRRIAPQNEFSSMKLHLFLRRKRRQSAARFAARIKWKWNRQTSATRWICWIQLDSPKFVR